jgi:hypothetical protein
VENKNYEWRTKIKVRITNLTVFREQTEDNKLNLEQINHIITRPDRDTKK